MVVEVHIFCTRSCYIRYEFLYSFQHVRTGICTIGSIIMRKDLVFMNVTDQRVDNTGRTVQVTTRFAFFWLDIDTTHATFVLLNLCSFQRI